MKTASKLDLYTNFHKTSQFASRNVFFSLSQNIWLTVLISDENKSFV